MDFNRFVKALALAGSEVYALPLIGYEVTTVNAMISNTLIELDR